MKSTMTFRQRDFLATLWVFVTLNYLYCDLIGLMDASLLRQYMQGEVDGLVLDEQFLFYAGIVMEIPIAMVLLCKVLPPRTTYRANIVAGAVKTALMVATLFAGHVTVYYMFFACVEIATTLFVVAFAWRALRLQSKNAVRT